MNIFSDLLWEGVYRLVLYNATVNKANGSVSLNFNFENRENIPKISFSAFRRRSSDPRDILVLYKQISHCIKHLARSFFALNKNCYHFNNRAVLLDIVWKSRLGTVAQLFTLFLIKKKKMVSIVFVSINFMLVHDSWIWNKGSKPFCSCSEPTRI